MAIATIVIAGVGVAVCAVGLIFTIMNHSDLADIKKTLNIDNSSN